MEGIVAAVLGVVQGLTEFLPVSSSGHLVIGQKFFGLQEHDILFDVVVHLGTLLAVLLVYKKVLVQIFADTFKSLTVKKVLPGFHMGLLVILATIPTAIIGLSFKDKFESLFSSMAAVATCLVITGFILFVQKFLRNPEDAGGSLVHIKIDKNLLLQIPWWKVLVIGFAQSLAIAPGISRSGTTIAVALMLGIGGVNAALFSFLLAIPAILGAVVLQFRDISLNEISTQPLLIGLICSFVSGYIGLRLVLKVVDKQRLEWFSFYVWILGIGLFLL